MPVGRLWCKGGIILNWILDGYLYIYISRPAGWKHVWIEREDPSMCTCEPLISCIRAVLQIFIDAELMNSQSVVGCEGLLTFSPVDFV
jgi:hypothetical protein